MNIGGVRNIYILCCPEYKSETFVCVVRLVVALAGVIQEESHTGTLHLPSVELALLFIARRILSSPSLVDREVDFVYPRIDRSLLVGHVFFIIYSLFFVRKNPSWCDCTRFELASQPQKVSRLPTEPPGRPAMHVIRIFILNTLYCGTDSRSYLTMIARTTYS